MIENNDSICYKNGFLSSVIFRIDLNEPLSEGVLNSLVKDKEIKRYYPVRGKDQVKKEKTINLFHSFSNGKPGNPSVSENEITFIIKELRSETRENKFALAPSFLIFEYG